MEKLTPAEYRAMKDAIAIAFADNIDHVEDDEERYEVACEVRQLSWKSFRTLRLSELKQILRELKFDPYNDFMPGIHLAALLRRFGDVECYFARENSPALYLLGIHESEKLPESAAGTHIKRQADGSVYLFWD